MSSSGFFCVYVFVQKLMYDCTEGWKKERKPICLSGVCVCLRGEGWERWEGEIEINWTAWYEVQEMGACT